MTRRSTRFAAALLLTVACGDTPASKENPAVVSGARPETALATVTLTPRAEERLGIQVALVASRTVARTRKVGGECMAPPGQALSIAAPFAGLILAPVGDESLPAVGATLVAGEAVLRLVPLLRGEADLRSDSQSEVATAQARVSFAEARMRRVQQLLEQGTTSEQEAEIAREQHEVATATLRAARARAARVGSAPIGEGGGLLLTAPRPALLQHVFVSPGQTVTAGAALFDVVDVDPIWVRVPLYVGDLDAVDPSAPALVSRLRNGGRPLEARRVSGLLSATPRSASADLYFEVPNPDARLRPGERVLVGLTMDTRTDALVVPWSAILYDVHGDTWVYTNPEPRVFTRHRVELSGVFEDTAVLERGPPAGTRVIAVGAAELFGTEFGASK